MNPEKRTNHLSNRPIAQVKQGRLAIHLVAIGVWVMASCSLASGSAHAQPKKGTTPAADAAEPSLTYTVLPQDKLIVLSRTLFNGLGAWASIAQVNGLKNPNLIYPGQTLQVPLRYLTAQPSGGTVINTTGSVSSNGQPLLAGTAIRAGQPFKTGADGSATIELGDGSRIKLLPNTLAEVVTNSDYAIRDASASGSTHWFSGLMRLTEGALEAFAAKTTKRATPLRIETPTSVVGVRGTVFRVAFDDPISQAARTEVLEGKVRADNPSQAVGADLPMGTGAVVKPLEKEIKVVDLLPAPDAQGIASEAFQPQASLGLPKLAGAANFRVLIASDEGFDKVARHLKVAANTPADLSGLPNGNWYVLVRGIDSVGLEGFNTIKLISIKDAPAQEPIDPWRPNSNRLISLTSDGDKTRISWTASPSDQNTGIRYIAQTSTDVGFTNPATTAETADRSLDLGVLRPGTYYIRLRFSPLGGKPIQSSIYRFTLTENWNQTVFQVLSALQPVTP